MGVQNNLQWFRACEEHDLEAVKVAMPTYAGTRNCRGETALILACGRGDRLITKILGPIECNIYNDKGETAILTAIRHDHAGCVSDMCLYEITTRLKDGSTCLHFAVAFNSLQSIVIMHGALKRAKDANGDTAFDLACRLGHMPSVQKLVELGTHLSKVDAAKAIGLAQKNGHTEVVEFLKSCTFPDIDPNVITASMRLAQSSVVSAKALKLISGMSAKEKADEILSHSRVMTDSFRESVMPDMSDLTESMRLAQERTRVLMNKAEMGKKKAIIETTMGMLANDEFGGVSLEPTVEAPKCAASDIGAAISDARKIAASCGVSGVENAGETGEVDDLIYQVAKD